MVAARARHLEAEQWHRVALTNLQLAQTALQEADAALAAVSAQWVAGPWTCEPDQALSSLRERLPLFIQGLSEARRYELSLEPTPPELHGSSVSSTSGLVTFTRTGGPAGMPAFGADG